MEETESLFVPVILSSAGRNNSFFTSELTLTNRGRRSSLTSPTRLMREEEAERLPTFLLQAGRESSPTPSTI